MYFSKIAVISLALLSLSAPAFAEDAPCRPFRVHMLAALPPPPKESSTLEACIAHYEALDINKNGKRDWTATADGQRSNVLFPADPDMDGDGVANVLDASPLHADASGGRLASGEVPEHLRMHGERGAIQLGIYRRFGILAIDHGDRHSLGVLRALELLLEHGLPESTRRRVTSVKYVYAFKGHDSYRNLAAYHRQVEALSIGGTSAYGENSLAPERSVHVLAALAHEIGHAFLFDTMSASDLVDAGRRFGGWQVKTDEVKAPRSQSLFDATFFRSHPLRYLAKIVTRNRETSRKIVDRELWREMNLVSEYGTTNMHEWFADAFAAEILHRLGARGHLGTDWRARLTRVPDRSDAYWVNYNNLSDDFRDWLESRIDGAQVQESKPALEPIFTRSPSPRP